jgi:hypothetical protein
MVTVDNSERTSNERADFKDMASSGKGFYTWWYGVPYKSIFSPQPEKE